MYDSSFGLENHGLANLNRVYWNLPAASLVEMALARGEGVLADNGALTVKTGDRTGRSPKDKFIVEDPASKDEISWGKVNKPIAREKFELLRSEVLAYLQNRDVFVADAFAGADPEFQIPIRFINEQAWQNLFVHQLFRRAKPEELRSSRPEFTVITVPNFKADPKRHGTNSEVFVIVDMENKLILIGGTHYAGEMKKSIFSVLNYVYPKRGVLSMHCAANLGADGDTAIFFGLSGTGKTTLSADPARRLIGDDQHGWSKNGVFNFEGGCYAKTIRLSRKYEPQIWNALRFGSVLENVIVNPETRVPDYDDDSITENTRGAYPVEFIDNAVLEGVGGHPKTVMFLAADAFGILPPISRLSREQAMYYFLSGYTAKLAGTEAGLGDEPEATFSTCFGAPFLPLSPRVYARMLGDLIESHNSHVYLVNTGWSGGPYGVGERISIAHTRALVGAAISGELEKVSWRKDPIFGLDMPTECPGVPAEVLDPRATWDNKEEYDQKARALAARFVENFKQFSDVSDAVRNAGPKVG